MTGEVEMEFRGIRGLHPQPVPSLPNLYGQETDEVTLTQSMFPMPKVPFEETPSWAQTRAIQG